MRPPDEAPISAASATPTPAPGDPTSLDAKPAAVDPRVARSRKRVLGTTFELLHERGVGGFTVDEVARRSGVAKTTIYRHWPTREALVIDACAQLDDGQVVPDTGALASDLTAILTNVATLLWSANWASVVPSIVDAAERDADYATVHAAIQAGHAAPLRAVIARAVERGELPAGVDAGTMVAALMGPLFYRRWFAREPVGEAFVPALVAGAIAAAQPA